METKNLTPSADTLDRLLKVHGSIAHQSVNLGRAILQADEIKSGLQSMYEYRQQLISQAVLDTGLVPDAVQSLHISPDGKEMMVTLKPSQTPGS